MPFARSVLLCSLLISSLPISLQADFLAAFSGKHGGFNKVDLSLSFLDPATLEVLSTTELGKFSGLSIATGFADRNADFLQVILPPVAKQPTQLLVFSALSRQEVARLPIGDLHAQKTAGGIGFVEIPGDQSRLYILGREKKQWRLYVPTRRREGYSSVLSRDCSRSISSPAMW